MTTRVLVTNLGPAFKDVLVKVINPSTMSVLSESRLLTGGYKEFYVYDSQSLRIDEIPKEE